MRKRAFWRFWWRREWVAPAVVYYGPRRQVTAFYLGPLVIARIFD